MNNFKTVGSIQHRNGGGQRGSTPNTNSNSPRKSSGHNKSHVLSTKEPQTVTQSLQSKVGQQNSVSMMVLQKLDNSLIHSQQSFTGKDVAQMGKTGFNSSQGKKKSNNKVLTAYLQEKNSNNVEEIDHRR